MRIEVCDICGSKIIATCEEEAYKNLAFFKVQEGYFTPSHHRAIINKKGVVSGHLWGDDPLLCPLCTEKINDAIWKKIHDIQREAPKTRTYKMSKPYKKFSAMLRDDMSEKVQDLTCSG